MTDRTIIPLTAEFDLMVAPYPNGVRLSLLPDREAPAHVSVSVDTGALLTAIDAADPDAMRAYLRETSPVFVADVLRPAGAAAEHFDYLEPEQLDAIPEADSPEDVDEPRRHCDPLADEDVIEDRQLCDPLTDEQLAVVAKAHRTIAEAMQG